MDSRTLIDLVTKVTADWSKQRRSEERNAAAAARRRDALTKSGRVSIIQAAALVIPLAYAEASAGHGMVHARQIYYKARPRILEWTGLDTLDSKYFTQVLLPNYIREHPEETADWDVIYDARGHAEEPHTGAAVELGTVEVRDYLERIPDRPGVPAAPVFQADASYPTCGPRHRYGAILFIEKEGFMPLFRKVRLKERYDLLIMSTKGVSVTAARKLVDRLCGGPEGVPLLVLHDFDKTGLTILATLHQTTRRYTFEHEIRVVDLGVRLADVRDWDLDSEDVVYSYDPRPKLREYGASEEEIQFLCSRCSRDGQKIRGKGRRVELNAFDNAQLIRWIEAKLQEHGIRKVIPDDATLSEAYRRSLAAVMLNQRIGDIAGSVHQEAQACPVPEALRGHIEARLAADPALSWDAVVAELAEAGDDRAGE